MYSTYLSWCSRCRVIKLSLFLKSIGSEVSISEGVTITEVSIVSIGNRVSIHKHVFLEGRGGLFVGNNVAIAPYSSVWTSNHRFDNKNVPIQDQGYVLKSVIIEDDVWIGAHSTILPGVTIGKGAVVGAGTVVTKNVPSYSIFAGNPGRVIRMR